MWETSHVYLSKFIELGFCFRQLLDRGLIAPESCMQMTAKPDSDRFQSGADKYAAYLETPEGRLRCGLALANLQDFLVLPQSRRSLPGLDLGCGTGVTAVRLARLGIHMTLLDSSSAMLDIANRPAREVGVYGGVRLNRGATGQGGN